MKYIKRYNENNTFPKYSARECRLFFNKQVFNLDIQKSGTSQYNGGVRYDIYEFYVPYLDTKLSLRKEYYYNEDRNKHTRNYYASIGKQELHSFDAEQIYNVIDKISYRTHLLIMRIKNDINSNISDKELIERLDEFDVILKNNIDYINLNRLYDFLGFNFNEEDFKNKLTSVLKD